MASPGSATPGAVHDSGDIELRFGNEQEPLRAHSQFLSLASPTVLVLESTWDLDMFFSAMPILHKYNFSTLLKHAAGLVESAVAWGQGQGKGRSQVVPYGQQVQVQVKGSETLKHSVGEWLWLLDELQLVGMHDAFQKLVKGLPKRRLCDIEQEVTAAAAPSKRISAVGMDDPEEGEDDESFFDRISFCQDQDRACWVLLTRSDGGSGVGAAFQPPRSLLPDASMQPALSEDPSSSSGQPNSSEQSNSISKQPTPLEQPTSSQHPTPSEQPD
eukprot:gene19034-25629_t